MGFSGHAAWPDWPLTKDGERRTVRPACALVPAKTRLFVDEVAQTIRAGWAR